MGEGVDVEIGMGREGEVEILKGVCGGDRIVSWGRLEVGRGMGVIVEEMK